MKSDRLMNFFTGTRPFFLDLGLFLLRLTVGIVLFAAGAGKLYGWFGGQGHEQALEFFDQLGIGAVLMDVSCYTEFLGGFLLVVGFLTRPAAFAVMINMIVATIVMLPQGFFFGGGAFPFILAICSLIFLLTGPMAISVDHFLFREKVEEENGAWRFSI